MKDLYARQLFRFIHRKSKYPIDPFPIYSMLMESQYYSRQEIESDQVKKINFLLSCVAHVPYYTLNKFSTIIKSVNDVKFLPEISRTDYQKNISSYANSSYKLKTFLHRTSGSSGVPLSITLSSEAEAYRIAGRLRFKSWYGLNYIDKGVTFWGGASKNISTKGFVYEKLKKVLLNRDLFVSVFCLNKYSIKDIYSQIKGYNPQYIRGYKSGVLQFAKLCDSAGLSLEAFRLRVVIVTSEVLIKDERDYLQNIFQCKVANEYGAVEAGLFAFECPNEGMHVFEESVLVNSNNNREIVSTELNNTASILINYKTGDKINFSDKQCSCGRTLKLLESVEGRTGDTILKPNGEELSQYYFYYFFKNLPEKLKYSITQYKIVQEIFIFHIYYIPNDTFHYKVIKMLTENMVSEIGEEIEIKIYEVEEIPREESGKLRFFNRKM